MFKYINIEREKKILASKRSYDWLEDKLHILPEKGAILYKMSLKDYERTLKEKIVPLIENASSSGEIDILSNYLSHRKEDSEDLLLKDVKNHLKKS